jgi:hypothetical protein
MCACMYARLHAYMYMHACIEYSRSQKALPCYVYACMYWIFEVAESSSMLIAWYVCLYVCMFTWIHMHALNSGFPHVHAHLSGLYMSCLHASVCSAFVPYIQAYTRTHTHIHTATLTRRVYVIKVLCACILDCLKCLLSTHSTNNKRDVVWGARWCAKCLDLLLNEGHHGLLVQKSPVCVIYMMYVE